ncbi:unnamed protein product [Amoebophrya sp. A25]|nr:unnamed protein product [Amoebophrya sp. A25]|eukprot:GSA25T00026730001.1
MGELEGRMFQVWLPEDVTSTLDTYTEEEALDDLNEQLHENDWFTFLTTPFGETDLSNPTTNNSMLYYTSTALSVLDVLATLVLLVDFALCALSAGFLWYCRTTAGVGHLLGLIGMLMSTWIHVAEDVSWYFDPLTAKVGLARNFDPYELYVPAAHSTIPEGEEASDENPELRKWMITRVSWCLALRMLSVCLLDRYTPALRIIIRIFRKYYIELLQTFYGFLSILVIYTWLMHCCEYDSAELATDVEDDGTKRSRYTTYVGSLQFMTIHATGDYPLVEYSSLARILHFSLMILMTGFLGAPTGLFAAVIMHEMKHARRIMRINDYTAAARLIQNAWRRSRMYKELNELRSAVRSGAYYERYQDQAAREERGDFTEAPAMQPAEEYGDEDRGDEEGQEGEDYGEGEHYAPPPGEQPKEPSSSRSGGGQQVGGKGEKKESWSKGETNSRLHQGASSSKAGAPSSREQLSQSLQQASLLQQASQQQAGTISRVTWSPASSRNDDDVISLNSYLREAEQQEAEQTRRAAAAAERAAAASTTQPSTEEVFDRVVAQLGDPPSSSTSTSEETSSASFVKRKEHQAATWTGIASSGATLRTRQNRFITQSTIAPGLAADRVATGGTGRTKTRVKHKRGGGGSSARNVRNFLAAARQRFVSAHSPLEPATLRLSSGTSKKFGFSGRRTTRKQIQKLAVSRPLLPRAVGSLARRLPGFHFYNDNTDDDYSGGDYNDADYYNDSSWQPGPRTSVARALRTSGAYSRAQNPGQNFFLSMVGDQPRYVSKMGYWFQMLMLALHTYTSIDGLFLSCDMSLYILAGVSEDPGKLKRTKEGGDDEDGDSKKPRGRMGPPKKDNDDGDEKESAKNAAKKEDDKKSAFSSSFLVGAEITVDGEIVPTQAQRSQQPSFLAAAGSTGVEAAAATLGGSSFTSMPEDDEEQEDAKLSPQVPLPEVEAAAARSLLIEYLFHVIYLVEYLFYLLAASGNPSVNFSIRTEFSRLARVTDFCLMILFWIYGTGGFATRSNFPLVADPFASGAYRRRVEGPAHGIVMQPLYHVVLALNIIHVVNAAYFRGIERFMRGNETFYLLLAGGGLLTLFTMCVLGGCWWLAERAIAGQFDSIPTSMMYVTFFLLGEWVTPDFEFWYGIMLCYFQCLVGLIFSGILIGAISDLLQEVLEHYVKYRDALDWSHTRQSYLDREKMGQHEEMESKFSVRQSYVRDLRNAVQDDDGEDGGEAQIEGYI